MAQFTVTVNASQNGAPTQLGYKQITFNDPAGPLHTYSVSDFTDTSPVYVDPEGDGLAKIKMTKYLLSDIGTLTFNGTILDINDVGIEITAAQLDAGLLTYTPNPAFGSAYLDQWEFDIADTGSGQYSGLGQGLQYLQVAEEFNSPPTIGDGAAEMDYQGTLVFTRAMFTTLTTPPYNDPEGDAALNLKILSLPEETGMLLDGQEVVINQVISFADIDAGLFTYTNDDVMDTNGDTQTFTFAISDAGSQEFVE